MSDILPHHDWWGSRVPASSYASDSIWEDLDGDIKLFVAVEELLTGE
jgi:hypothetical protein